MADLFSADEPRGPVQGAGRPLADRMRPARLSDVIGQDHLVGPDGAITRMVESGSLGSVILWGPPGTGKTTIARLLATAQDHAFEQISAVFSGVADLKKVFDAARLRATNGKRTVLFVDEIHRFNRAQQDSFLPVMEDGTVILIGATTENPSFELNSALLSRARVLVLNALDEGALSAILDRAQTHGGAVLPLDATARATLVAMADGDGRALLTLAEEVIRLARPGETLDAKALQSLIQKRAALHDKDRDGHYNLISALHKAVRGSDPDAALYWLARMIAGGEQPMFLARRLIRMASEDIGLADPQALAVAVAARDAYEMLGSPEGELALAEACAYLATAPKSNAVYVAWKAAMADADRHGSLPPPKHILNAPTKLMADEGYSAGYLYDHDQPDAFSGQDYFPDRMGRRAYYKPVERGFERDVGKRLAWWADLRARRAGTPD